MSDIYIYIIDKSNCYTFKAQLGFHWVWYDLCVIFHNADVYVHYSFIQTRSKKLCSKNSFGGWTVDCETSEIETVMVSPPSVHHVKWSFLLLNDWNGLWLEYVSSRSSCSSTGRLSFKMNLIQKITQQTVVFHVGTSMLSVKQRILYIGSDS